MKQTISLLSLVVSAFLLTACGGSGGDQPSVSSTHTNGSNTAQPDTSSTQTGEKGWDTYKPIWNQSKDIPNVGEYHSKTIWLSINNKKYQTQNIDITHLPLGLNTLKYESHFTESEPNQVEDTLTETGTMRLYKQKYSVVVGTNVEKSFSKNQGKFLTSSANEYSFDDDSPQGQLTPFEQLPKAGRFTYNGSAFTANEEGKLIYTVDFDKREGNGSISGLNYFGDISLNTSELQKNWLGSLKDKDGGQIFGDATSINSHQGKYELNFFGPNAEEIGGRAYFKNNENNSISIGIAGSREQLK